MAVSLIHKNVNTNTCIFAYDNWVSDVNSLPNLTSRGKGVLSTIPPIRMGSKAIGTNDGITKILTGANKWVNYSSTSSGSSGGSTAGDFVDFEDPTNTPSGDGFVDLDGDGTGGGSSSGSSGGTGSGGGSDSGNSGNPGAGDFVDFGD